MIPEECTPTSRLFHPFFIKEARLAQLVRRLYAERMAVVRIFLLLFCFASRMRHALADMCTSSDVIFIGTTWVMLPKSITSSPIPEFFMLQARPWLPPWGTESWPARTPWVKPQGFFSGRGKPLVLWRGTGASPLEKRERGLLGTPDGACGQPERELPALTLVWISSNPLWGGPFSPRANFARGPTVSRTGSLGCTGAPESLVRSTQKGHPPLPRGAKCSRGTNCGKRGKLERENQKRKRKERKKGGKGKKNFVE